MPDPIAKLINSLKPFRSFKVHDIELQAQLLDIF
jgi:hypothetical protein